MNPRRYRPGNAPYYSAREIADLLGLDLGRVLARAHAESWPIAGILDGRAARYPTLRLPRDVVTAIRTGSARRAGLRAGPVKVQWWAQ